MSDTAESDRSAGRVPYLEYPPPSETKDPDDTSRVSALVAWAKNSISYLSMLRMRRWAFCRLADLFFDGDQHPTADSLGYVGVEFASYYSPDDIYLGLDASPRPTMNEYKDVILNEQSRIDRSDYEPTVRPSGSDPTYKQRSGAKIATRALRSSLEEDNWEHKKRTIAYHMPSYGGAWVESLWETSMEETIRVPVDGCQSCPVCQCKYAPTPPAPMGMPQPAPLENCQQCINHDTQQPPDDLTIAARMAQLPPEMIANGSPHPDVHEQLKAPMTVTMPGGPPLQPFIPSGPDLNAKDPYGRPLGEDVPIGHPRFNVLSYGDVFEENLGINAAGEMEVRDVTLVQVRSLDYIRARWKNARSGQLLPESPAALHKYHPISAGDWMSEDDAVFRNAARVIRRYRWPWMEERKDSRSGKPVEYILNRGKAVVVCGGLVLQDDDLMLDGPDGTSFPRVLVTYTPHDIGNGGQERMGSSLSKQLIDPQRGINQSVLQDQDEQKSGQSRWLVHDGVDVQYENSGQAGATATWHAPEGAEQIDQYKPVLVSRTAEARKWGAMADYYRGFMGRSGRLTETESGSIPPDAPASALQISREESGEVRKPRVEALAKTYQKLYRHRLQLMQKYVVEPRVAWDRTDSGQDFQSWYKGADFAGQTDVLIDVEGAADTELLKQKKLDDAINGGVIDMTNANNRRVIGKLKGVPADFFAAEDLQDQTAEREYLEFCDATDPEDPRGMRFGPIPVVDPGVDNNQAHIFRHTKDIQSDKWREIERAVNWDKILTVISGWKQLAVQAATPQATQPPSVAGMPPAPPVVLPPNIDLLLPTPQLWITNTWAEMLLAENMKNEQGPTSGIDPADPAVLSVLSFRAHLADHQIREVFASGGQQAQAPPQAPPPPQ